MKVMKSVDILLDTIDKVKAFTTLANEKDFDIDLTSGRYIVDAKSIMGIFSLDLSKPVTCEVEDPNAQQFFEEIKSYIAE